MEYMILFSFRFRFSAILMTISRWCFIFANFDKRFLSKDLFDYF